MGRAHSPRVKRTGLLRTVASELRVALICTIHQPSASVFEAFDDCLILSGGRVAYLGQASAMASQLVGICPLGGAELSRHQWRQQRPIQDPAGLERGLKSCLDPVAPFSQSSSPWRVMAIPFIPQMVYVRDL